MSPYTGIDKIQRLLRLITAIFLMALPVHLLAQGISKTELMAMPESKAKVDSILSWSENNRMDRKRDSLYKEAFRLVDKLNYKQIQPALYNSYGVFKRDISEYSESIAWHIKALELAKDQSNVKEQIKAFNNLGVAYRRIDDYITALDYLMAGRALAEKAGDDYSLTIALNSIGNIHVSQGNYRAAADYFLECIPISKKANNERGLAINMQNLGECYEYLKMPDSASYYYNVALDYNRKRDDEKGIAVCYNSLGSLLQNKGRLEEALRLYKMALPINIKLGDKMYIAQSYTNIGNIHMLENDYARANIMFDSSLQISSTIGSVAEAKNAYAGLMKTAQAQNKWELAYKYGQLYKMLSDSMINFKNTQTLRTKEIAYHQNKIALLESNNRNDRIILIGSTALFFLLLISGVLFYLRNRLLDRNRSLQRELEIRSQIASDLHDDMGSSLSSIHIFSELLRKNGNNSHDLLSKIEANAKDTLDALDDIIWLVKPTNDKFSNLSMHINEFSIPLFESKNIDFEIDFPDAISGIALPMETRRNIFLIIKESVNNLVKYSECTKATITANFDGTDLCFKVLDNGKGFDLLAPTNRNGVKNLKTRANQINARLTINTAPGKGTEIILRVDAKELTLVHAV